MIKRFIPSTLIGRSIIIIFVPIIILVLLTSFVFYQTSWSILSKRLSESVVADINVRVKLIDVNLENYALEIANKDFKINRCLRRSAKREMGCNDANSEASSKLF